MNTRFDPRRYPRTQAAHRCGVRPEATDRVESRIAGRAMVVVVTDRPGAGGRDRSAGHRTAREEGFVAVWWCRRGGDRGAALETAVVGGFDFVVTVGGRRYPRDITPEVTEDPTSDARCRRGGPLSGLTAGRSIDARGHGVSGSTVVANLRRAAPRSVTAWPRCARWSVYRGGVVGHRRTVTAPDERGGGRRGTDAAGREPGRVPGRGRWTGRGSTRCWWSCPRRPRMSPRPRAGSTTTGGAINAPAPRLSAPALHRPAGATGQPRHLRAGVRSCRTGCSGPRGG